MARGREGGGAGRRDRIRKGKGIRGREGGITLVSSHAMRPCSSCNGGG